MWESGKYNGNGGGDFWKAILKSSCKGFTFSWRCVAWERNEVVRLWRGSILMDDIDIHPWWQELCGEIWRHDDECMKN